MTRLNGESAVVEIRGSECTQISLKNTRPVLYRVEESVKKDPEDSNKNDDVK